MKYAFKEKVNQGPTVQLGACPVNKFLLLGGSKKIHFPRFLKIFEYLKTYVVFVSRSGIIDSRPETVKAADLLTELSTLFGNKYIILFWIFGVTQMPTCVRTC